MNTVFMRAEKFFAFAICDNNGKVYAQDICYLKDNQNESLSEFFNHSLEYFLAKHQFYQPKALGIALPGHFSEDRNGIQTNNPYWKHFNFEQIPFIFKGAIFYSNNVECMALSERLFNNFVRRKNFSFLHVGRGMFCSRIYEGRLYGKDNILIGEVGHVIVHPDGELCECGKRGCLQTYASEAWIIKKSQILYQNSDSTYLKQLCSSPDSISVETILKAYLLGDEGVITILHNTIKYLAITINNISMMIDASQVIIHGQLFENISLFSLLEEHVKKNITLLTSERKQTIYLKEYHPINGAVAACSLCVEKLLLN